MSSDTNDKPPKKRGGKAEAAGHEGKGKLSPKAPRGTSPLRGPSGSTGSSSSTKQLAYFEDLDIKLLQDNPAAVVDLVLLRCSPARVMETLALASPGAEARLPGRVIVVNWSDVDTRLWSHFLPLISMVKFLLIKLKELTKLGKRPILFITEGTLPEWLAKQFVVSNQLAGLGLVIAGVILPVLVRPPESVVDMVLSLTELLSDYDEPLPPPSSILYSGSSSSQGLTESDSTAARTWDVSEDGKSPRPEMKKLFSTSHNRDQLLMTISYVVALDQKFEHLQPRAYAFAPADDKPTTPRLAEPLKLAFKDLAESQQAAAPKALGASTNFVLRISTTQLTLCQSHPVTTLPEVQVASWPLRFISTTVKLALNKLAKISGFAKLSDLADALRRSKVQIQIAGPAAEIRVAQIATLAFLRLNPGDPKDIEAARKSILSRPESSPGFFDKPRAFSAPFLPMEEASLTIQHLQEAVRRSSAPVSSQSGSVDGDALASSRSSHSLPELDSSTELPRPSHHPIVKIAFFGAPSVGKSTLINCILGESLVYTSIKESTGALTEIIRSANHIPRSRRSARPSLGPSAQPDFPSSSPSSTRSSREITPATLEDPSNRRRSLKASSEEIDASNSKPAGPRSLKLAQSSSAVPSSLEPIPESHPTSPKSEVTPRPAETLAEVVFITPDEFDEVIQPIHREIQTAHTDIETITTTSLESLAMSETERDSRVAKLTAHIDSLTRRKDDLTKLFQANQETKVLYLRSRDEVAKFIKLEESKGQVSLADIVAKVRVFMPDNSLLEYITIVDTPGWNLEGKAFAEDFRVQRSQTQVADVDMWVYLTAAYEADSLSDNIKLIKSLTRDNTPGMIAITCYDTAKDQQDKGFEYCVSQKLEHVTRYFEGSGGGVGGEQVPIMCAKLVSDCLEVKKLREETSSTASAPGTSPVDSPKHPAFSAAASTAASGPSTPTKVLLKRKWRTLLDTIAATFTFVTKSPDDEEPESTEGSDDDDMFQLDSAKKGKSSFGPIALENYVRFLDGKPDLLDVMSEVAMDLSGLPHFFQRLTQSIQPSINKVLSFRYSKIDQNARSALSVVLKSAVNIQQELKSSFAIRKQVIRLVQTREALQQDIEKINRQMHVFGSSVGKIRTRLETSLDLVFDLLLSTSNFTTLLETRKKKDKRKGFDLFFVRRQLISIRDYFDSMVRTAFHQTIARALNQLAAKHMTRFAGWGLVSPIDYSRLDDFDFWIEEAQCITFGDHAVELRGSETDMKAIADWLRRVKKSCATQKDRVVNAAMRHFDDWCSRLIEDQKTAIDVFGRRKRKHIDQAQREMEKARDEELNPQEVAKMQAQIQRKKITADSLFDVYLDEVFASCVKYYT